MGAGTRFKTVYGEQDEAVVANGENVRVLLH
jgi:hypothetical protein